MSGETTAPGLVPRLRGEWAMLTTDEHADVWRLRREAADAIEQHVAEILRLRAELAALREPAGDLVEVAADIIQREFNPAFRTDADDRVAREVIDAVLPRVRAEGWRTMESAPKDETMFMAVTAGGRMMLWRGVYLASAMKEDTPDHLRFPAVAWRPLPPPPDTAP